MGAFPPDVLQLGVLHTLEAVASFGEYVLITGEGIVGDSRTNTGKGRVRRPKVSQHRKPIRSAKNYHFSRAQRRGLSNHLASIPLDMIRMRLSHAGSQRLCRVRVANHEQRSVSFPRLKWKIPLRDSTYRVCTARISREEGGSFLHSSPSRNEGFPECLIETLT